ncbi:hypothetical protein Scep_016135 [Stephania cephalantha]|uniref:Cytochrome b561 domain-containing protein n=1 Tax=Stephania cephalantha TaxID=152367 RepID=A0AAP0NSB7_9MAGN
MAPKDSSSFRLTALPVVVVANILSLAFVTLILVWALHFQGGLGLKSENVQQIFNIHPVLMVIGPIFIGGEAIMVYKMVPSTKKVQKLVHLILHLVALALGIVGITAIFKFQHDVQLGNLRTLHSWLGIGTISLYGLQWLFAAFSFWFPRAATTTRAKLLPWHWFAGMAIFVMAVMTAETGLNRLTVPGGTLDSASLVVNFTGLLILLFAVTVSLSVILPGTR